LSRPAEGEEDEPEFESDPVITGERQGVGWSILQVVGGVLALPFLLYQSALNVLERVSKLGDEPGTETGGGD
ncbi:MAG TPA: hypothetical protein VHL11_16435, partial [Phototrophicaceae bacterium]|nr:hypothetical protein [Phototrophicaceae bacterium]